MLTIQPAYGRDYKTAKEAKADWEAGKDFQINNMFHPQDGAYVNKEDGKGQSFLIRFCRNTKTVTVKG